MSDRTRFPIQLTVTQDVSDGFRATGHYDSNLALDKRGSVVVDLTRKNNREEFEIFLVDKNHRWGTPATINLNVTGLFRVVQDCRNAWETAFESLTKMLPDETGAGKKPFRPYENAWDNPIDSATFDRLAGKLAVAGDALFTSIFERNRRTALDDIATRLREWARSDEGALTVNATDFHIPWRMLYTHPDASEPLAEEGVNFQPAGFWGYQLVIEQFTKRYDIRDHVLARNGKLGFCAALHERLDADFGVECLKRHHDFVQKSVDLLSYSEWTKRAQVIDGLRADPFHQQVLYFLCHAEGAGTTAVPSLEPPFLKLADKEKIAAAEIRNSIENRFEPSPPLIFINACRGGQLGTLVEHNFTFASEFLEQGAVCFIGPQVEVPAVFAGEFGKCFFEQFMEQTHPPPLAGVVLRDVTREMWLRHNPFGLVYSLYAGADCHIRWEREGVT